MSDKLDLILKELQSLNSRVTNIELNMATKQDAERLELQMSHQFDQVKDKLRIIEEQTVLASELQAPVSDLQQQVKDHDTDIKLIKRMLTAQ